MPKPSMAGSSYNYDHYKPMSDAVIARKARRLRDQCLRAMKIWQEPGDAEVTIAGNDTSAATVLSILEAIGVAGCDF